MIEVKRLSEREFLNMRDRWSTLLERSKASNFFLCWEWLSHWWKHFGEGNDLLLLGAFECDELCGIIPLTRKKIYYYNHLPVWRIGFVGRDFVHSDYLDFVFEPDREAECLERVLGFFRESPLAWDLLELTDVPCESSTLSFFKELAGRTSNIEINKGEVCPYLALPHSVDKYYSSLSQNMRYNIRRRTRNLYKRFGGEGIEFEVRDCQGDLDGVADLLGKLFALHRRRWDSLGKRTVFGSERVEEFHRTLLPKLLDKGNVVFYSLRVGKKVMAVIYGFKSNGKFLFYQSGFDPEFASESPGLVLMNFSIEEEIRHGLVEYDFLRGEEEYKRKFTKTYRQNYNITIWNNSAKRKYLKACGLTRLVVKKLKFQIQKRRAT